MTQSYYKGSLTTKKKKNMKKSDMYVNLEMINL